MFKIKNVMLVIVFSIPYILFFCLAKLGNYLENVGEHGLFWLNIHPMIIKKVGWKIWTLHFFKRKK